MATLPRARSRYAVAEPLQKLALSIDVGTGACWLTGMRTRAHDVREHSGARGNLDGLLKSSQESESLLLQLPPQNTEAEMARRDPGHGSHRANRNPQHPRHAEASANAMEGPPALYEAKRITAAKAKRAARKSQEPRINTANAQALPPCSLCQSTFRARFGLVGHLRTQCNNNRKTSTSATSASDPTTMTNPTTDNHFIDAPQPTTTDTILHPPPLSRSRRRTPLASLPPPHWPPPTTCHLLPPPPPPPPPPVPAMGIGTNLSSLRSHIRVTHQPSRSFANPSHRARRTRLNSPHCPHTTWVY
ncbi:unnamed protein product [Schistocephalus solidus]|uniref:C2H2-type domain-containing protein n=1 Tax=Schistocephalus solidus TaxID=70667 RepID=A0A183SXM1_SCHSO|nr:unnamed protein product [Schistocephalus solidus]